MLERSESDKVLFGGASGDEAEEGFARDRRLISDRFREVYQSWTLPEDFFGASDLAELIAALVHSIEDGSKAFLALLKKERLEGGVVGDLAIDLIDSVASELSPEDARAVVAMLFNVMDEYYVATGNAGHFMDAWSQSRRILRKLVSVLRQDQSIDDVILFCKKGQALSWITQEVVRAEMFSHGWIPTQSASDEHRWIFTNDNLKSLADATLERLEALPSSDFIDLPRLAGVLYFLRDYPDGNPLLRKVVTDLSSPLSSDALLLRFLSALQGRVSSSSSGVYLVLSPKMMAALGVDEGVSERVKLLEKSSVGEVSVLASELSGALDRGIENDKF